MKRSFLLFLLLSLVLLFTACGGGNAGATEPTTAETTAAPETTAASSFEITFAVGGSETKVTVAAGQTPEYPGETSWETSEHFCKITGWDKEFVPATEDTTYTATVGEYGLTLYDVRFVMPQGVVSIPTHEGEVPTPPVGYETDLSKVERIGTFDHWNPELTAVTAQKWEENGKKMVYSPSYTYKTRYYNVTFVVQGVEHTVQAAGKTIPECPVNPADVYKDDITVRFAGWDKEIAAVTEDATYTAVFGNSAQILPAKNGAKGILTMTYDDGILATAKWVNTENKKYGLTGSCMMVPNSGGTRPNYGDHKSDWIALFSDGTLEPQNHSMTHVMFPYEGGSFWDDETKLNCYQENYDYELVQSKNLLKKDFGYPILCFAPANNTLSHVSLRSDGNGNLLKNEKGEYIVVEDGGADKVACNTYYAIRRGTRAVQSLDPTMGDAAGGWYNLCIRAFKDYATEAEKVTKGKSWIDETVADGNWLIIMCHGIYGSGASGSGDITTDSADQFFAYASNYVKSGELWAATFGDATKYIRERQNTTVLERYENGTVYVEMKINRTAQDGKYLAKNVFNYPLTVEVRVPSDWTAASYELNGETVTISVQTDPSTNQKYALINVIPGEDGAVSTTTVTKAD